MKRRRALTGRRIQSFPAPFFSSFWGLDLPGLHGRAAVGKPRDHAHEDGQAKALGQVERLPGHIIRFLVVGGLVAEDLGELDVVAAVLLVLRAVHARVVGADDEEAAVGPGDGGVHEGIRGDVEADVLERDEGPLPGERNAEGFLVGDLLVHRPDGRKGLGLRGQAHEVLQDLGRGGAGIGISRREARMGGPQGHGFVSEEDLTGHGRFLYRWDFGVRILMERRRCQAEAAVLPSPWKSSNLIIPMGLC